MRHDRNVGGKSGWSSGGNRSGNRRCEISERGDSNGRKDRQENFRLLSQIFAAAAPTPEAAKRNRALAAIRLGASGKKICYCPSFWVVLRQQCGFIPKAFWLFQGMLAMALAFLLQRMDIGQSGYQDYLVWFSVAAALMGVVGITQMGRHCSYHMMELEQSCYLNLGQLWTMSMILSGGVDILLLSVFTMALSKRTGAGLLALGVYVLVPFVLSNLCCLFLLSVSGGATGKYSQLGMAAATGILAAMPSVFPGAYRLNYLWVWTVVLGVLVVLTAAQLRNLYVRLAKGEILCWS